MLNSRYAPIVAITVVLILILVALGWFLAIKPQVDEASRVSGLVDEVETNIAAIDATSARLDEYQATLDALPDLTEPIAQNAPSVWDMPSFRARLDSAIKDAGLEIVTYEEGGETAVEGWPQEPAGLMSTQVATLFQTGPVHLPEGEEYTAPAAPVGEAAAVADGITGITLSFSLAGTPSEMLDFFQQIQDPEAPLFQVYDVTETARPEESSSLSGVSDASDGDLTIDISGFVYMLNPDPTIIDEEVLEDASLGGESPFTAIEDAPDQPGAN
ncbi:hypothetical protein [Demequina sp. SO4-18]|uniref:hypothetical protein n=1 Tax=Demequina sp. SO4-18 TaxID=3401026 RepID=UPI003B5BCBC2